MQGRFRHDIHFAAKYFFQILPQPDLIQQATARLKIYQQIQVAFRPGLAPRQRTEDADIMGIVFGGEAENIFALGSY